MKKAIKKEEKKPDDLRYITKIHMENFQDHTDTIIELTHGINLVTGSSDAGKSAALRAINYVLHNQPKGDSFIQLGSSEARVTLEFSDGMTAQRIKGKSRNAIIIEHPDWEEPIVKDNFGIHYPDDVVAALGNPPIDPDEGPISYAEQMSPLFLVGLTSSELPSCLSRLTGIDDFEEASKNLASKSRDAGKRAKDSESRIKQINDSLEEYIELDNQLIVMETINELSCEVDEIMRSISNGKALVDKHNIIMEQARAASRAMRQSKKIVEMQEDFNEINELNSLIELGYDILSEFQNICNQESAHQKAIEALSVAIDNEEELSEIKEQISLISLGESLLKESKEILASEKSLMQELQDWELKVESATNEINSVVDEMKLNGLWCDKCDRPLIKSEVK